MTQTPEPLVGHVYEQDIPWVWAGDVGLQLLRATPDGFVVRNRFKAGFQLPMHKHTGTVNAYTFAGEWYYAEQGIKYTAGTYVHEPPGSVHTLTVSQDDTDVLFMVDGAYFEFGPDGTFSGVVDSDTILAGYYALCDMAGVERPTGILR